MMKNVSPVAPSRIMYSPSWKKSCKYIYKHINYKLGIPVKVIKHPYNMYVCSRAHNSGYELNCKTLRWEHRHLISIRYTKFYNCNLKKGFGSKLLHKYFDTEQQTNKQINQTVTVINHISNLVSIERNNYVTTVEGQRLRVKLPKKIYDWHRWPVSLKSAIWGFLTP